MEALCPHSLKGAQRELTPPGATLTRKRGALVEKGPSCHPAVDASGTPTSCGHLRGGRTKPFAHNTLPLAFPPSLPHSPDSLTPVSSCHFFFFLFILLYNIVLVLPYLDLNPPWVYMCSPLKKAPTSTASFPSAVRLPQASLPPQDLPNASSCLQSFRAAVWPGGVSTPSSNHNPQASGHRGCARGRCIPWPV